MFPEVSVVLNDGEMLNVQFYTGLRPQPWRSGFQSKCYSHVCSLQLYSKVYMYCLQDSWRKPVCSNGPDR